jgi:hypothetical protein
VVASFRERGCFTIIWDWKSARVLFVRQLLTWLGNRAQARIQELEYNGFHPVELIDDYRLLFSSKQRVGVPPSLVLMDTEEDIGGTPIQTTFLFPPHFVHSVTPSLISERGMHNLSLAKSPVPFHQDPAQRIIALRFESSPRCLVLRVGALLELFKDREGTEIGWEEWKNHVVIPSLSRRSWGPRSVQVSGCRLIFFWSTAGGLGSEMEVFDFSKQGRAKHLKKGRTPEFGRVNRLFSAEGIVQAPSEGFLGL